MTAPSPTIVAMGGGGFSMEPDNPLLDDWLLSLTGKERPRVCFLGTASGDADSYLVNFYKAFGGDRAAPSHLALFRRTERDIETFLKRQDVIYVGGGNTANMLAVWRVHGVDGALRSAWQSGVVLAGLSAGSLCWFEAGVTDSFGPQLQPLLDGLGFLDGSHCPHYDGEPQRRPAYQRLVASGQLADGVAIDDGAAVRYAGGLIVEAVSSRPAACAYRVVRDGDDFVEEHIETRFLGAGARVSG